MDPNIIVERIINDYVVQSGSTIDKLLDIYQMNYDNVDFVKFIKYDFNFPSFKQLQFNKHVKRKQEIINKIKIVVGWTDEEIDNYFRGIYDNYSTLYQNRKMTEDEIKQCLYKLSPQSTVLLYKDAFEFTKMYSRLIEDILKP